MLLAGRVEDAEIVIEQQVIGIGRECELEINKQKSNVRVFGMITGIQIKEKDKMFEYNN